MAKKMTAVKERYTKTQIISEISENTELTKKEVQAVLDELADVIERHIKNRACGEFILPGLMKIQTVKKPARKARPGANPFTGEEIMISAKPASTTVRVRPLKKLKDMAL
jgi:nucleoid DNA-binding protein